MGSEAYEVSATFNPNPRSVLAVSSWLQPERVFVWLSVIFGLVVLGLNPPFQAADETDHFKRIVQLSDGDIVGERRGNSAGGHLPMAAIQVADTDGIQFDYNKKVTAEMFRRKIRNLTTDWKTEPRAYAHFPHTVYYPPIGYAPQVIAVIVGKSAHAGGLILLYLARLAALAMYTVVGTAALRRLPAYRWSSLLILLMPMSLYLGGSCAPDGLLIGSGFLLAALATANGGNSRREFSPRWIALFLATCAMMATMKAVYLPLAVAAGAVIWPKLPTWRGRIALLGGFALVCLLPSAIWSPIAQSVYVPGRETAVPIDPIVQSHYILAHPGNFLAAIGVSFRDYGGVYYRWFVGMLGWGDTPMPSWYYWFFTLGFGGCVLAETGAGEPIPPLARWAFVGASIAAGILIFVAQYATWNPPGAPGPVEGICGRYFIPIVPFMLLALPRIRPLRLRTEWTASAATGFAMVGAVVCAVAVVQRYYVR